MPFSGITKSGRVWRKVPESDAQSVPIYFSVMVDLEVELLGYFQKFDWLFCAVKM